MRRQLTFALILVTLAYWGASLWTLEPWIHGTEFILACAPAAVAFLMLISFLFSGRIFAPNDKVRRLFSTVLAVTLLIVLACVYVDILMVDGMIFERGLELFRLEIFADRRLPFTLAFAGAIVHPVLFVIAGLGLLALPPPRDSFFSH
ncbi:hypothetical protein [Sutterella sp.]|uniref:hypothetical protein n=1 Tax=Sutterella sp. TaxID=1981025 RepID=UPI0026DEE247|nr:hypothetical protein [Sutterella sp.]MDO5530761.1 hypothetical protein [Sutterella sp.]